MKRGMQGVLIRAAGSGAEPYKVYRPEPLPPAINYPEIAKALETADRAVGELNGVMGVIPGAGIINYVYVRKEAVLSSQIEGTQSTFDDLLTFEASGTAGVPVDDVAEVSSYVAALDYGLERMKSLPLSLRLIREIHKVLMANARGKDKSPGQFRVSQNWIGGTRPGNAAFVPVSPAELPAALGALEKFIHVRDKIPELVRAALLHHQFETIHPFLDGNGRVGRLLITIYLCEKGILKSPYLYLSLFFKKHRRLYYEHLNDVRTSGDWEAWINFFLDGVAETAANAKDTLVNIRGIFQKDEAATAALGRSAKAALKVLEQFRKKPVLKISELTEKTGLTKPTAISSVERLIALGILSPLSERKWGRVYAYANYINALNSE